MKKISLNIDALQVTTFAPEPEPQAARGTVHGHITLRCPAQTFYCTAGHDTCQQASCVDTCGYPYKPAC
jgi:hypothetical protein